MTQGMPHGVGAETPCPERERPACVDAGCLPRLLQPGKLQLPNVRTRRCAAVRSLAFAVALLGLLSAPATADNSGRLRLVQVLEDGKEGVEGLYGPALSALSPDGANVYVANFLGDSVAVFARNAQSGRLTFLEAQRNPVNGVDGLGNAIALAVSPDGAHV